MKTDKDFDKVKEELNSYFEEIFNKIQIGEFSKLRENHLLFNHEDLDSSYSVQFNKIISETIKILDKDSVAKNSFLLDYIWVILDWVLHYAYDVVDENFENNLSKLGKLVSQTNTNEDSKALLIQKIEHYGINVT